ncbi:hypothetical protein ACOMHN_007858 [Nucella lapillus]
MKTATSCLKVVVLGAPRVGKSAVTVRFLTRRFIGEYSSGMDCTYQTMFQYEETAQRLEIVDCTPRWDGSSEHHLEADAYIIVYSITDTASLKHAHTILDNLHHHHHHHHLSPTPSALHTPTVLLLGNKTDLQHLRQVSRHDVTRVTQQYPACRHSELSAAESCRAVDGPMQEVLAECAERREGGGERGRCSGQVKSRRKKSLFGHVSRRLGCVFRGKSLDEFPPRKRRSSAREVSADNLNRRSV